MHAADAELCGHPTGGVFSSHCHVHTEHSLSWGKYVGLYFHHQDVVYLGSLLFHAKQFC